MTKPITDPHAGQYQVVVSFRYASRWPLAKVQRLFQDEVLSMLGCLAIGFHGNTGGVVDVAAWEIGAQGEASEDEGRVG